MQLFEDSHKLLRDCVASMELEANPPQPDEVLYAESKLVFQPAAGIEETPEQVRIRVRKKRSAMAPDWAKISEAAEDFCGAVLSFAFNPLMEGVPRHEEGREPVTVEGGLQPGSISISGPASEFTREKMQAVHAEISHLEQLMFKGWEASETPTIVEKTFAGEEEKSRVMHLLATMGEAFGYSKKAVRNAFHEAFNEETIRIDQRFLTQLIQREQTQEGSIALQ